jgi:methyl-accepting chemotaxis protein
MSLLRLSKTLPAEPAEGAPAVVTGKLKNGLLWLFWTPLIFTGVGAVVGWEFVYFAFSSAMALNGKILIVMLWGSFAMYLQMRVAYSEDRAFHAGMDWLRKGAWSTQPNPRLGRPAFVQGMLERLEKMGLGHQVYVQSAAMEPELEALKAHFLKRQELSNFLVGLMVGLGLLGTFIGLLQTLIATSELIGGIASALTGGGNLEAEFAKIVGGLQKPLASMGTAFSASMFGLIGSIMLGFQTVVVNKTVGELVDGIREEVMSLAEKSKDGAQVEITERYLATLMADMMEQHRASEERLADVALQLKTLTPQISQAALSSERLAEQMASQQAAMVQTATEVGEMRGAMGQLLPALGEVTQMTGQELQETRRTRIGLDEVRQHLPDQAELARQMRDALRAVDQLRTELQATRDEGNALSREVKAQAGVLKRIDAQLYQANQDELRRALGGMGDGSGGGGLGGGRP